MRSLPSCGEGFRRLSLVAAILSFLFLSGCTYLVYSEDMNSSRQTCFRNYGAECTSSTSADTVACHAAASDREVACLSSASMPLADITKLLLTCATAGLLGAYLSALSVRTLGWVVQGFATKRTIIPAADVRP